MKTPSFILTILQIINRIFIHVIYKVKTKHFERLPQKTGGLIVPNHVTYMDGCLLAATSRRRIRFVMERRIYNHPRWRWFFKLIGVIPISEKDSPRQVLEAIRSVRRCLKNNELVCVFGEGELTPTGNIMGFKRGLERMVRQTGKPIIPVHIHGLWGSYFSLWRRKRRPSRPPVTLTCGAPMPLGATAFQVRAKILEMGADVHIQEKNKHRPLAWKFVGAARTHWSKRRLYDSTGLDMTYGRALTFSLALARVLKPRVKSQERMGLILPPSVGGVCANVSVSLLNRVPVNLNHTASKGAMRSAIKQCNLQTIITSRRFVKKTGFSDLQDLVYLEDLVREIGWKTKLVSWIKARFCPRVLFGLRAKAHDTAAVIFSSGSTGRPKGIELTHGNIGANIESAQQIFRLDQSDGICGVLPFFHSLGFMGTLWFPLVIGLNAAFHYNPNDGRAIGSLVKKRGLTFLLSTPTFLKTYLRRVDPQRFLSLSRVVTGAEPLPVSLADAFEQKFGIRPNQGYGVTELSPVACVSTEGRDGSMGFPLPGVAIRVVDPDHPHKELAPNEKGLLQVKGPNVMKGYLNDPEKTEQVMETDWYVTGDIGMVRQSGEVCVADRLSRFSKVGGEMAPHLAIEEALHVGLPQDEFLYAVTALPDEKKGEKLVVLHTRSSPGPQDSRKKLKEQGLPNLWIPAAKNFLRVKAIPLLGTGKLDLKKIKSLAKKNLCSAPGL